MSLIRLDEVLLVPIELRPAIALGVYQVSPIFAPQKSSSIPEACGVELLGGQLREDDEIALQQCEDACGGGPCGERYSFTYASSTLYPLEVVEELFAPHLTDIRQLPTIDLIEALNAPPLTFQFLTLRDPLAAYDMEPEALESPHLVLGEFELRTQFVSYTMEPEALESPHVVLGTFTLETVLIVYTNYPAEAIESPHLTITSASLT